MWKAGAHENAPQAAYPVNNPAWNQRPPDQTKFNKFIFLVPAFFDLSRSALLYVAIRLTYNSSYMMIRSKFNLLSLLISPFVWCLNILKCSTVYIYLTCQSYVYNYLETHPSIFTYRFVSFYITCSHVSLYLHVFFYIYLNVRVCIYLHIHMSVFMYMFICLYVFIYMFTCLYLCTCSFAYMYFLICSSVCMFI